VNSTNLGPLVSPQLTRLKRKYAVGGKVQKVMHEYKHGELHSGSKKGPIVKDRKQAIAIALSEKRRQIAGKYASGGPASSWWMRLQKEISALGPQAKPQGSPVSQQQPMTGGLR
jgi:hypothetical protein